ncbi:MAG TPA: iron chaperone [Acholeplasmatales bacterium]|nr:iron chaperone [Acholeplasmatales bacterium]
METFDVFLNQIEHPQHRAKLTEVLARIGERFPMLQRRIAWNQPMFTDHGTFIIAFSVSKNHFAVAPEKAGMIHFHDAIAKTGYEQSMMLFRIRWDDPVDEALLDEIIRYNMLEKAECKTFWR